MPGSASGYFRRRAAAERGKRLPRAVVVPPMGKKKKRRRAAPVHVTAVVEVSLRHEFAVWRGGGCSGAVPLAPEPSASPRREGTIGPTLHFQLEVRRQTEGSRGRARQHRARSDAGDTLSGRQGGAGKTSLAVETQGLLLDLAPQPSACRWGDRREDAAPVVLDVAPARLKPRSPRPATRASPLSFSTPRRARKTAALATPPGRLGGHPVPAADGRPRDRSATVKLRQLLGGPATVAVLLAVPPRGQRTDQARGDCSASACGCARTRPGIAPPGAMPSPWADSGRASAHGPCRGRAAAAWSFPNLRNNRSCSMAKKPNLALVADAAAGRKPAPAAPARPRGRVGTVALTINVHPDVRQQTEDPRASGLSWFGSATRLAPRRQTGCRTPCSAP